MSVTATWFGADQNQEIGFRRSSEAGSSALMSSDEWRLRKLLEEEWVSSANRLNGFDKLADDWDGLGATAPDQDVVQSAKIFLSLKRKQNPELPPSRVLAAPDGSIVFEWQSGSIIFEIEIDAPGRANYMLEIPGKSPRFWTEPFEITSDEPWTVEDRGPRHKRRDATWENSLQHSPAAG